MAYALFSQRIDHTKWEIIRVLLLQTKICNLDYKLYGSLYPKQNMIVRAKLQWLLFLSLVVLHVTFICDCVTNLIIQTFVLFLLFHYFQKERRQYYPNIIWIMVLSSNWCFKYEDCNLYHPDFILTKIEQVRKVRWKHTPFHCSS